MKTATFSTLPKTLKKSLTMLYTLLTCYITSVIAAGLLFTIIFFDLDFFESLIKILHQFEHFEADEIVLLAIILMFSVCFDIIRQRKKQKLGLMLEHEKLQTLKTTVRTAQDIVGNFLNNLLYYKIKLDKTGTLDQNSLKEINHLIYATSDKLNRLGNINTVIEKEISKGIYIIDLEETASEPESWPHRYPN